jgi:hypothetical protein
MKPKEYVLDLKIYSNNGSKKRIIALPFNQN